MPNCWNEIKNSFKLPKKIVHIIGTNGKGTTGRFLATYLKNMGFSVGHYSSPHILKFNERIWINGEDISDKKLEKAHKFLQKIIPKKYLDSLSYFEYTTILAMKCFENLDYVILEAGLGGERDATSVFKRDITLVTPIDFDHQSFLGDTIKEIATTKLNSIKNRGIIGEQIHKEVLKIGEKYPSYKKFLNKKEKKKIQKFIIKNRFPKYLIQNLSLALAFIKEEGLKFDLKYLKNVKIRGRMEQISKNLFIDVGHNRLASKVILKEFKNQKIDLIYNTYSDKDYKQILTILKPIIKKLFIIKVKNDRIEDRKKIIKVAKNLKIDVQKFKKVRKNQTTLVFGSFSVVEKFLNKRRKK